MVDLNTHEGTTTRPSPRVCLVSEDLASPQDEGIRKFALSLLHGLRQHGPALGLSIRGAGHADGGVVRVASNRLFLDYRLRKQIAAWVPDVVCYVPSASCTPLSFLRSRLLGLFYRRARVALVALQPRKHSPLARRLITSFRPHTVFAQSVATLGQLRALRCDARFLPSGVDLARFRPVLPEEKAHLRRKYGLPAEDYLALHIGHLKRSRNIGVFNEIRDQARPVLVVGRSEGYDAALRQRLEAEGVIIIDTYLKDVEEIYQACDCYLFPVEAPGQAIDIPLSVLEAMACNLPVIAHPFGGLPLLFRKGPGFWFAADREQLRSGLAQAKQQADCGTRAMVEPYGWERVAAIFLAAMEGTGNTSERASAYTH